jgi:uncharacterized protein YxeA
MKKILIVLILLCIAYGAGREIRNQRKSYLRKETYVKHLQKDTFLNKLNTPLAK